MSAKYYPVDCVALGPNTTLVDFDGDWSVDQIPNCDGIAIAGLLEHIRDPLSLIRKIAPLGRVWVVSYMAKPARSHRDLMPLETLEQAFADAGMRIAKQARWKGQRVYKLVRK